MNQSTLEGYVVEALSAMGGRSDLLSVAKYIWQHHEDELRASGDMFYRWQYVMRWAATRLRKDEVLLPSKGKGDHIWELAKSDLLPGVPFLPT
jgi:hypothetical protein